MADRLPPRDGEWIDRGHPIRFRYEGREYGGFAGDTVTTALWASGVRLLGRSFKYHRPRGIMSLANHDANVMVEDAPGTGTRRTNLRADVLPIEERLDLYAVNTRGGLARDRLRITQRFSRFLPVGFYYKAFYSPRALFPFYERSMREVAGLGRIDPDSPSRTTPKRYDFCDLLVVGAGPSGLAAAIEAARQGVHVVVVDEEPRPGGSLTYQWSNEPGARARLKELLAAAERFDNLELRLRTVAAGCYGDLWMALVDDQKLTKLRATATVVAAGVFEQPAVFHNNDLPGVMLGTAAQRLLNRYAVRPFRRCVVLTANLDGFRVALDLHAAGVDVAAVADIRLEAESTGLLQRVKDAGIHVHHGYCIYEAHGSSETWGLSSALLCRIDEQGKPRSGSKIRIDCDGIAVSVGWAPAGGLLYQAGGRFGYADHVEQFVPRTLPDGVFSAGRINGVYDLDDQIADGQRAGLEAAAFLGRYGGSPPERISHRGPAPSHPFAILGHPKGKNFVDLDEDLHLADFINAQQEGYDNIELMKRYTTFGMGASQGKLANMNAVRILARLNGTTIDQISTVTSRPFHHPVELSHLAGKRFHPLRRTPMHEWHKQAGAHFMHLGSWLRPEYYAKRGKCRENCILDEARNVRENVGLIDVGTLGKIEVSGPDAVVMLERIYTGRFTKQKVGRLRYGVACDEVGVIIEDGVVARMGEDRFYVTATTSGVDGFFRELQRWAMIWSMNVALVNVTGQFTAMNIAGPRSRQVLAPLVDIDLSPEAFPYLAVREGKIAEAPARVMRVGFVGELGYEIHVPASHGLHVWTSLMGAGASDGIAPTAVEAQRILRLEKGHIIVGQDTDALTNPYEADLAWAIGKKKPFFVGQRSLAILQQQPVARCLVGIAFPSNYQGPLPEECHLVIEDGQIAGRVTSFAKRSTLGLGLGLAYVQPDQTEPGTPVHIRVDGGDMLTAHITTIPFYDPENARQD